MPIDFYQKKKNKKNR